jgi:hypothetical protein
LARASSDRDDARVALELVRDSDRLRARGTRRPAAFVAPVLKSTIQRTPSRTKLRSSVTCTITSRSRARGHSLIASTCVGSNSQRPRGSSRTARTTAATSCIACCSSSTPTPPDELVADSRHRGVDARIVESGQGLPRKLREHAMADGAHRRRRGTRPLERGGGVGTAAASGAGALARNGGNAKVERKRRNGGATSGALS